VNHSIYWHLPPLLIAVGFVYAATRHEDWHRIVGRTLFWIRYIAVFLLTAFVAVECLEYFKRDSWKIGLAILVVWLGVKMFRRTFAAKQKTPPSTPTTST
jgi:uncharacterized membrane protein YfcA